MIPEAVFHGFSAITLKKPIVSGRKMPGNRRRNPVTEQIWSLDRFTGITRNWPFPYRTVRPG
jgi:hypothetical protein